MNRDAAPMFSEEVYATRRLATQPSDFHIAGTLEGKYVLLGDFAFQHGGWTIMCLVQDVTITGGPTGVGKVSTSWGSVKTLYE